ncbi:TetR/AcrR family transcriptional regulator [Streptomyces sp. Go40/10]|uniref:ScbR family autoregulator-binding transcription factor n=1 Tax=Streptomyces sp. Go40/10 TaxID=2825844 RepID=UPI001E2D1B89|nr:ScbR family autoregulator-binding transcription factor [Streptomyces sp. Go40/10]UFR03534.1 TetR/AcrR family transcriptional regulator [Streptomyces sp. Go40/10]
MAQQERGIRSRRSILEAAAVVFGERGYDAASTNEILARAGLTRGALYHHFPSKEAIAAALAQAHGEALVVPDPDQPVKLQSVIDLTLAFSLRLQTDMVLRASVRLAVERSSFSMSSQTPYNQSITLVEDLLRQADKQGELLPGTDLSEVASTIVGAYTGLQVMSEVYSSRQDLPARISALWRLLLPGLAAPGMLPRLRTSLPPEPPGE